MCAPTFNPILLALYPPFFRDSLPHPALPHLTQRNFVLTKSAQRCRVGASPDAPGGSGPRPTHRRKPGAPCSEVADVSLGTAGAPLPDRTRPTAFPAAAASASSAAGSNDVADLALPQLKAVA